MVVQIGGRVIGAPSSAWKLVVRCRRGFRPASPRKQDMSSADDRDRDHDAKDQQSPCRHVLSGLAVVKANSELIVMLLPDSVDTVPKSTRNIAHKSYSNIGRIHESKQAKRKS